jgi:DNA-binding response OmpR family regulator
VLYGEDAPTETKIVEVYISHIRKKLRELTDEDLITNQRGRGWVLRSPAQ